MKQRRNIVKFLHYFTLKTSNFVPSYKIMIPLVMLFIFSILIFSIFLNFFYASKSIESLFKYHANLHIAEDNYSKMDFSLRIFNNILNQKSSIKETNSIKYRNLKNAYLENLKRYTSYLTVTNELAIKDVSYLKNLNRLQFSVFFPEFKKIESINNEIVQQLKQLMSYSKIHLNSSEDFFSSDTKDIMLIYNSMSDNMHTIVKLFNTFATNILQKYILLTILMFSLLFLTVLILAFLLVRILISLTNYTKRAFIMLDSNETDLDSLPKIKTLFREEKEFKKLITHIFVEKDFIKDIKNITAKKYYITDILEDLLKNVNQSLNTNRIAIASVDYLRKRIVAEYSVATYSNIHLQTSYGVSFDSTSLKNILETKEPLIINDIEEEYKKFPKSKSLELIYSEGIRSNMIIPLFIHDTVYALLFFSSFSKNNYDHSLIHLGRNIGYEISAILDKTYLVNAVFSKISNTFAELVDKKDNDTGLHINRMVQYSEIIARALVSSSDIDYKVSVHFASQIEANASIHDVGKVGIPDAILKKPGKLNPDEWDIMKTHAEIGGNIFKDLKESLQNFNSDFYAMAENIAFYHHEKWDGSGYPFGLSGKNIPLEARIVAIADVFDALTTKRVYKDSLSFEASVDIVNNSSGSHFDPYLVEIFNQNIDKIKKVYMDDSELIY